MSDTIYDALGGHDTIVAVVDGLYHRLLQDPRVRHHFDPERVPALKAKQVEWFTACLTGAELPTELAAAHAHLHITDEQVAALLAHLDQLLVEAGVNRRLRAAVDSVVSRMWHARRF